LKERPTKHAVLVDTRENHRNATAQEAASEHPHLVVIDPDNGQVHAVGQSPSRGRIEVRSVPREAATGERFASQVPCEAKRFVTLQIGPVKTLASQVAGLHLIPIDNYQVTTPLARQTMSDLRTQAPSANLKDRQPSQRLGAKTRQ
jgi:hypothetical protein